MIDFCAVYNKFSSLTSFRIQNNNCGDFLVPLSCVTSQFSEKKILGKSRGLHCSYRAVTFSWHKCIWIWIWLISWYTMWERMLMTTHIVAYFYVGKYLIFLHIFFNKNTRHYQGCWMWIWLILYDNRFWIEKKNQKYFIAIVLLWKTIACN